MQSTIEKVNMMSIRYIRGSMFMLEAVAKIEIES